MKTSDGAVLAGWQYAFAGGAAGAATRALFQPLDVLKIRFQLQVDPIKAGSKYSSLHQAVNTILKEEGVATLWSGHVPAQYLSISFGIAQFWCYEFLTSRVYDAQPDISASFVNFTCGAIAGSFASFVSFPFDTVRTRMVADSKIDRVYKGMWQTFRHMYTIEGRFSFYKGLFPTIAQIAPHSGAQFMFYKIFNEYLFEVMPSKNKNKFSFINSITSGSLAGFLAKLCIYPFDLAKKRLQIQGFQHKRTAFGKQFYCKGFVDCFIQTLKKEGFLALYKGLYPSLIKATLVTSSHFVFYDHFCFLIKSI